MRRSALLLIAAVAASALSAPAARASVTCDDVGPVPGYGPVCTVTCAMKTQVHLDDPNGPTVVRDSCWWED